MTVRLAKTLLVAAVAFYMTLVVINNLVDYGSNYLFVHHVLEMDTTFPGNHGMGRALHVHWEELLFYDGIIMWETVTLVLCWAGAWRMARALRRSPEEFNEAKNTAVVGLALNLLLWLVAFLSVGGEWFLMWQSKTWDGREAAGRMFAVVGVVFLAVLLRE
ncbi:MAG TPA: DUF2165 domain-containing protein [Acidobacteriaceae bacterium]|jgi:predicted small integral membrane protein|nr:DUF2165 domain-containing protein [Acidobacteriaceae bacterium]